MSFVDLVDPSIYPEFVLAIHSSKRLLVEQVSPPSFVLADTIINLTLAKGQRHEVNHLVNLFILTIINNNNYRVEKE